MAAFCNYFAMNCKVWVRKKFSTHFYCLRWSGKSFMKIGCSEVPITTSLPLLWPAEWKVPAPLKKSSSSWLQGFFLSVTKNGRAVKERNCKYYSALLSSWSCVTKNWEGEKQEQFVLERFARLNHDPKIWREIKLLWRIGRYLAEENFFGQFLTSNNDNDNDTGNANLEVNR